MSGEIVAMLFVREGEVFRAHNWLKSQTEAVWKGLSRWPNETAVSNHVYAGEELMAWLCGYVTTPCLCKYWVTCYSSLKPAPQVSVANCSQSDSF